MGSRGERPHQRPRSMSGDSDEDRYRERKKLDRNYQRKENQSAHRNDHRRSEHRSRYADEDRRRRRSRSPGHSSVTLQRRERSPKHRHREYYSPKSQAFTSSGSNFQEDDSYTQAPTKNIGPLPSQAESFSMINGSATALIRPEDKPVPEKQKPNFAPTGLLAAASNTLANADGTSIVLKYHEPPEARKPPPKDRWKLFVFKGSDILETIELSLRSCWLVGRELAVADLAAEHPSISKQHAVIQFRWIEKINEFGDKLGRVRPYLIDLESANGTKLNKEPIPSSRYLELRDTDMIQFGDSTREYVLMLPPKD